MANLTEGHRVQACSEFELFKGIIEWSKHRGSCAEASDELTPLLPCIRFPVMLPEQLQVLTLLLQFSCAPYVANSCSMRDL
jgi:hypothetical protein